MMQLLNNDIKQLLDKDTQLLLDKNVKQLLEKDIKQLLDKYIQQHTRQVYTATHPPPFKQNNSLLRPPVLLLGEQDVC